MRDRRQIVRKWKEGDAKNLVTLVRVQGSSYRQVGARLLIGAAGDYEGSISGGCLEADVLRKVSWLVRNGATVESYSTLFDEAGEIPFGLGCGGVVDLLLEPVDTPECEALIWAMEASLNGQSHSVVTWLPAGGRRMKRAVFTAEGRPVFSSRELSAVELAQASDVHLQSPGVQAESLFTERLDAPQRLYVFGAGDDAKPIVSMASLLGWTVMVIDGRSHLARLDRFPEANLVTSPSAINMPEVHSDDAVVLMTHSYQQDLSCLALVLPLRPKYLGLLGSRQRSSLLIAETAVRLGWTIESCCELINAPIGLDIGGDGPEAIALAVVAEIQACSSGRQPAPRRLSVDRVEGYLANANSERYLQARCELDRA